TSHVDGQAPPEDCHFVPLELLQRTYGSEQEGVIPSTAGRRIHVLQARLGELSRRLSDLGRVGDVYSWVPPADAEVPPDVLPEEQQPYQPAQADRLQISGRGSWDPLPYLPPDLQMAFAEPRSLLFGGLPSQEVFPDCSREDPAETLKLALLWSAQGLLHLEPFSSSLHPSCYTRIFAARKASGKLRQIGDRRGPNFAEVLPPCWTFAAVWAYPRLIIDDFFAVAKVSRAEHERLTPLSETPAKACMSKALRAYQAAGLAGSPEKDVTNSVLGTVAGAEVDSRGSTLARGACLVGAPRSKRFVLSDLSLEVCCLPATTDSLNACLLGSWTSAFTFRRPCFCVFGRAFALSPLGELDPAAPKMLKLPRAVAQEFQLAAALAPVACSDVAAPFAVATDASESKGACVSAPLPEHLRKTLWATADRKGAYARVCSPAQALLRRADPMFEEKPAEGNAEPERPLAFLFDFLAVGSRSGLVREEIASRGWVAGPLISEAISPHFCLGLPRLLDWIYYLIEEDRVRAIYVAVPFDLGLASFRRGLAILLKARAADVAFLFEGSKKYQLLPVFLGPRGELTKCGGGKARHATRRTSAIALAAGLYHGGMYCPTRLIPADNPRLRRWAANWARLVFALWPPVADLPSWPDGGRHRSLPFRGFARHVGFDSTLGFPGEGPASSWTLAVTFGLLGLTSASPGRAGFRLQGFVGLLFCVEPRAAMDTARARRTEAQRKEARAGTFLEKGRPTLATTRNRREKLQELFEVWLRQRGRTWAGLLSLARYDIEQLNEIFIWYGQWLYAEGKPYYHLSETINCFSVACPHARRQLQAAWDIAYAWQREEPPTHHTAVPWQILAAMLSVSMLWGWMDVAGILAICWGGLARVGEATAARRKDLVLPEDVGTECGADGSMVLMAVMEPKTRFKAARHQCVKVDQPQLVRLVRLAFHGLLPDEKLWPRSGAALRARFQKLLAALGLYPNSVPNVKGFDLASLRAGGATWLMACLESPDVVRRRGRWVSAKVMEIYIQEVSAMMFLPRLGPEQRRCIFNWANVFDEVLDYVAWCQTLAVPARSWLFLLQQGVLHA
ncbi:mok12, partial [Symbiodinium necroappetens]